MDHTFFLPKGCRFIESSVCRKLNPILLYKGGLAEKVKANKDDSENLILDIFVRYFILNYEGVKLLLYLLQECDSFDVIGD